MRKSDQNEGRKMVLSDKNEVVELDLINDRDYFRALSQLISEWSSKEDNEAYKDL